MISQDSAKNLDSSSCQKCKDTGWEDYEKDGYWFRRECSCGKYRRDILANRISFADIPVTYKDLRLSNFDTNVYQKQESIEKIEKVLKAVRYWLSSFNTMKEQGNGLYLYSASKGSGKTRMAACIANELICDKRQRVKFATSMDIINEIKSSWFRDNDGGESKLLETLSTVDVLIIDDFGTEQAKEWIGERFYQILNTRYVNKRITLYTSNHNLNELDYDDRIVNRIKERTFQIPFPEESIRDIIAKQNMTDFIRGMISAMKS